MCEKVWWGKRLAALGVTLSRADRNLLSDLLVDAWEHKAPARLLALIASNGTVGWASVLSLEERGTCLSRAHLRLIS